MDTRELAFTDEKKGPRHSLKPLPRSVAKQTLLAGLELGLLNPRPTQAGSTTLARSQEP